MKKKHKIFKQGLVNSTDETWFKDVYQVKPSHYLEIIDNKIIEKIL